MRVRVEPAFPTSSFKARRFGFEVNLSVLESSRRWWPCLIERTVVWVRMVRHVEEGAASGRLEVGLRRNREDHGAFQAHA